MNARSCFWLCFLLISLGSCREPSSDSTASTPSISKTQDLQSERHTLPPRPYPSLPSLGEAKESKSLLIGVISDLNGHYGSTIYNPVVYTAVQRLIEWNVDLVLCTGDMVAGQREGLDYAAMWRAFHRAVSDPLFDAGIPLIAVPGNHDASAYEKYAVERQAYQRAWRFRKPQVHRLSQDGMPFRYAFELKGVLFVGLDLTIPGKVSDEQKQWLRSILRQYSNLEPKILFGHLPFVPFSKGREKEIIEDPEFVQILKTFDVDLYINGHHQVYYPGFWHGLRVLSAGCLGGGARMYVQSEQYSERSIALIRIDDLGIADIQAYAAPRFEDVIEKKTLPSHLGAIQRDDLSLHAIERLESLALEHSWMDF